ncbi:helix-turn-helix domain-containing protein [Streptomyces mirabilis]|uniref:helix-turn-helix domain-containing protein n=1 Tax=Streptomyces mirabilis TaxID=68239 RepID=UPI0036BB4F28
MSHPAPSAVEIMLPEAERAELVRRTGLPHRRSTEKARIILACADGMSNAAVARLVGVQATTVGKWRRAFAAERMAGLEDAGWIGRPKVDLILDDAERRQLQQWARQARTAQFLALRAKDRAALRGGRDEPAGCGRPRHRQVDRGPLAGPVHRKTPRWSA